LLILGIPVVLIAVVAVILYFVYFQKKVHKAPVKYQHLDEDDENTIGEDYGAQIYHHPHDTTKEE
jgi:flagellar basal body-associated protein FliL